MCVFGIGVHGFVSEIEPGFKVKVFVEDEAQKCSYVQLFPFENGQIYQNGGFHTTATVPSVDVHVHTGAV